MSEEFIIVNQKIKLYVDKFYLIKYYDYNATYQKQIVKVIKRTKAGLIQVQYDGKFKSVRPYDFDNDFANIVNSDLGYLEKDILLNLYLNPNILENILPYLNITPEVKLKTSKILPINTFKFDSKYDRNK